MRRVSLRPGQLLGRRIHVVDIAAGVGRNDALTDRFERELCLLFVTAKGGLDTFSIGNVLCNGQNGLLSAIFDQHAGNLNPGPAITPIDQLHLRTFRPALTGQPGGNRFLYCIPVGRTDQIGYRTTDQLIRIDAQRLAGNAIRKNNSLAVNEDQIRQGVCEIVKQCLALAHLRIFGLERIEQQVDGAAQFPELWRGTGQRHSLAKSCRLGRFNDIGMQFGDLTGVTAPAAPEHSAGGGKAQTGQCQETDQPGFGHAG